MKGGESPPLFLDLKSAYKIDLYPEIKKRVLEHRIWK